jgi:hypothetical protein
MIDSDATLHDRIVMLVDSASDNRASTDQFFTYAWTMLCVRRGLMRVVREVSSNNRTHLIVEEARTGRLRVAVKPGGLDDDTEALAVQAFADMLSRAGARA